MPMVTSNSNELVTWTQRQLAPKKAALDLEQLPRIPSEPVEEEIPTIEPRMSHDSTNSYLTYHTAESEREDAKQELQELKGKLLKIKEKKDQESLGS